MKTVWFWFAPYAGLVVQTRDALSEQCPGIRLRELAVDRSVAGLRDGDVFVQTWAAVAANNKDARTTAIDLLAKNIGRKPQSLIFDKMRDTRPEVRLAAARAVGDKKLRFGGELIKLLDDKDDDVRQAARRALVNVSDGKDFGPNAEASQEDRAEAVKKWKEWWGK